MSAFLRVTELIGGLGLFLFGMHVMSDSLQRWAGGRMRRFVRAMTGRRLTGLLTGAGVTVMVQSSSATTVLLVSLVNAGLISLQESIGVIMGANIGTTFTAWLVSLLGFNFRISSIALPAVAVGLPLFFSRRERRRDLSKVLIGFGVLFLGLAIMKESVPDIRNHPEMLSFVSRLCAGGAWSILLFVVLGSLLSIVVQSSSAAMAITITAAWNGWISFPIAAAVVLGENIGTTVTAYLASLGMNLPARRCARAHMLFNIIGVLWILILFQPFLAFVDWIVPGSAESAAGIPVHLAAFHSIFNICNALLLIGFVPQITALVTRLERARDTKESITGDYHVPLVTGATPQAIGSNLIRIQTEAGKMAEFVFQATLKTMNLWDDTSDLENIASEVEEAEKKSDIMRYGITHAITECSQESLSESLAVQLQSAQVIVTALEHIADSCVDIIMMARQQRKSALAFHSKGEIQIRDYIALVVNFLRYNTEYLQGRIDTYSYEHAYEMEEAIDRYRDELRNSAQRSMSKGANVRSELLFIDLAEKLEGIGDKSLRISKAIRQTRPDAV